MSIRHPIVAIVGRPNVGKSTLFNRLLGSQRAVVEGIAGVTRDRNYALVSRFAIPFYAVDTGGFEEDPEEDLTKAVVAQTVLAIEEADLIFAVFDGRSGLRPGDDEVVRLLRRYEKPVVFLVNKIDGKEHSAKIIDFYDLGVSELQDISALYGHRVKDVVEQALQTLPDYVELVSSENLRQEEELRQESEILLEFSKSAEFSEAEADEGDEFAEEGEPEQVSEEELRAEPQFAPVYLPGDEQSEEEYLREHRKAPRKTGGGGRKSGIGDADADGSEPEEESLPQMPLVRIAIIGRPNVGKSTLINTLYGERRAITSPIAGTTRDSLYLPLRREEQEFVIIDTAGMRKQARVDDKVERYSVLRSLRSLSECDVAIVVIDAAAGVTEQDVKITGLAHDEGKAVILAVNKWDLVTKDHTTVHRFTEDIRHALKFAPYAPIVYVSALSGRRCPRLLDAAKEAAQERARRVSTARLNRVIRRGLSRVSVPMYRGRPIKLYFASQISSEPPRFVLFFNYPKEVHFSYLRFIKNLIREEFGFIGTDIKLATRKRGEISER